MASILRKTISVLASLTLIIPILVMGDIITRIKYMVTKLLFLDNEDELSDKADRFLSAVPGKELWIYIHVEVEGRLNAEELANHLESSKMKSRYKSPRFRKLCSIPIQKYGIMYWRKDRNFNIRRHIEQHEIVAQDEKHLQEIFLEYVGRPQPGDRSPWSMVLIPTREETTVILFISEHAITDGVGAVKIINALFMDSPGIIPHPKSVKDRRLLTTAQRTWNCLAHCLDHTIGLLTVKESRTFHPKDQIESKSLSWCTFSQTELPTIRRAIPGCTINDIMSGVIWNGLVRYMKRMDIPIIPPEPAVNMLCSTRTEDDIDLKNRYGLIPCTLSFREDIPVVECVKRIQQQTSPIKPFYAHLSGYFLQYMTACASISNSLIGELMQKALTSETIALSNVAGPAGPVTFMNRAVKRFRFLPTFRSFTGLSFGISSYNGELVVAVTDRLGLLTNSELLIQYITDAYQDLQSECSR